MTIKPFYPHIEVRYEASMTYASLSTEELTVLRDLTYMSPTYTLRVGEGGATVSASGSDREWLEMSLETLHDQLLKEVGQ